MQVVMKYYMRTEINSNEWSYLYLATDIQPSWRKAKHELDSFINVGMYWYHDKIPTQKKQHQLNLTLDSIPSSTNLMHAMYSLGKTNSLRVRSTDVHCADIGKSHWFMLFLGRCTVVLHCVTYWSHAGGTIIKARAKHLHKTSGSIRSWTLVTLPGPGGWITICGLVIPWFFLMGFIMKLPDPSYSWPSPCQWEQMCRRDKLEVKLAQEGFWVWPWGLKVICQRLMHISQC